MKSKTSFIPVVLSILSLIASIVALCVAIPRANAINFDYLGLLVGILALLVTALIGWNIYNLIDVRNIRNEQNSIQMDLYMRTQRILATTDHAVGDVFYRCLVGEKPMRDDFQLVYYRISEIQHLSCIADYKFCEALIVGLQQMFADSGRRFRKEQAKNLWNVIAQVKGTEHIGNFSDLMSLVSRMSL